MFSGIIIHSGTVFSAQHSSDGLTLQVAVGPHLAADIKASDSVCVNGVCLTATRVRDAEVTFDVVPETLTRSSLQSIREGELVNIELALRVGDRIGGHFVYGHVDRTVNVASAAREGSGIRLRLELPEELRLYVVTKGFIAIDGISLTVASVSAQHFEVAVIPETLRRTTLAHRQPGSCVNLEVDPLARYAVAAQSLYDQATVTSEELAWAYEI